MGYLRNIGNAALGLMRATAGYEAAGTKRRLAMYRPSGEHTNSMVVGSGDLMRNRARDAARNDPWASGGIDDWASEAIGSGVVPFPQHPNKATRETLKEGWKYFSDEADAAGRCSVYGLQSLAFRAMLEGGETFTRIRQRRLTDNLYVPLKLQVLESEHVPYERNFARPNSTNTVYAGIEFNGIGERTAYYMYRQHPGDRQLRARVMADVETVRVPAESVIHQFKVQRPGQIRGISHLVRCLVKLYQLSQYDDAQLEKMKLSSMLSLLITPPTDNDVVLPTTETANGVDPGDERTLTIMEPGTMAVTDVDGSVTVAQGDDPGPVYEAYKRDQITVVARALDMAYWQLSGDLRSLSYSSIRGGLIKFRRKAVKAQKELIVWQWCRPVWNAFITGMVLAGHLDARDVSQNLRQYRDVIWQAPKWEWVDPLKDVQADKLEVDEGFASRSQKIAERGSDAETVDAERAEDREREQAARSSDAVPPPVIETAEQTDAREQQEMIQ